MGLRYFLVAVNCVAFLFIGNSSGSNIGRIWHVTDFHLEPNYTSGVYPASSCRDLHGEAPRTWGDYRCDSPWVLINSSVYAMRDVEPNPDFIIWTGDDTPHVPNGNLDTDKVLDLIWNVTSLLMEVFPDTTVFPVLGNHDYHPKHMMPPAPNRVYETLASSGWWGRWLSKYSGFKESFEHAAYYTAVFSEGLRIVGLNTVYYYTNDKVTEDLKDPGNQFKWLEYVLGNASVNGDKVYLIGHVPPGVFERHASKSWFYPQFNERYIDIITQYSDVISGQFFAHQHVDSFRMFYDSQGSAVNSMFLTPAVTPWNTTLPGVGPNNPGIRLFEYNKDTLDIMDLKQYYADLSQTGPPSWKLEYSATSDYGIENVTTTSLQNLVSSFQNENSNNFDKYYRYNSVSYDLNACDAKCKREQICAITCVDFREYAACLSDYTSGGRPQTAAMVVTVVFVMLVLYSQP